jgi:two-component system, sensor histidine kinase
LSNHFEHEPEQFLCNTGRNLIPKINPELIDIELIKLVKKQAINTWLSSFIGLLATGFIFWGIAPTNILLSWCAAHTIIVFIRIWHTYRCPDENSDINTINKWKREFILLQALGGLVWGSMPILLITTSNIIYLAYVSTIMFATAMVTLSSFSLILPAYYFYVFFCFVPLTIYNLSAGMRFNTVLGIATPFLIIVFVRYAKNVNKTIKQSFKLRFENLDLIERLKKEKDKAEKASHDKSQFLAAASHDLRQPLHSLGLFLGGLEEYISNTDGKLLLDKSNRSLRSLKELFDSLLDISKLDAGAIEINREHFYLSSLFEKMETEYQRTAENKNLELIIKFGNQTLYSDPVLLTRCLRNFINNAIKHTSNGKIIVTCENKDDIYRIEVIDTGLGILENEFENIFNEFHQLSNPERDRQKGLGLGLAIVKRLSNLLEHDVGVESTIGSGACFYICVPKGNADEIITRENTFRPEMKHKPASILVIDDESDVLDAISTLLNQWHHKVKTADSIEKAIEVINHGFKPDLILTDYRLRNHDTGMDAIERINDECSGNISSIIITGDTSPERIKEAMKSKHPLIHKPVSPIVLRNAINQALTTALN